MGRSHWRNKRAKKPYSKPATSTPKFIVQEMTPQCPGGQRDGLDGFVTLELQKVDVLIRDMRLDIPVPNSVWDEDTAVKRYLIYLSMLTDVIMSDMLMSAIHGNDLAVLIKARILVEYANKAIYCQDHPDYALYLTTIAEAESVYWRLREGGADPEGVANAKVELERRNTQFASVAKMKAVKLGEMMRQHTRGGNEERNDEYVWLYGAPSALLHGDPEGMRTLIPVDSDGNPRPSIALQDNYLNALMVDVGSNVLIFCETFLNRFKPDDVTLQKRLMELAVKFKELSLTHAQGRTEEALTLLREELQSDTSRPHTE
jgi:hypothetical protein